VTELIHLRPLKPRRLKPGDTIGVVAPASPFEREDLERGLAVLHSLGFATRLADGVFERNEYLAGSDRQRAAQLYAMFRDTDVDAVMCARGGFGSLRILALLDYDLVRAHPKPFIGFSDITALHQAFFQRTGLVTFHGPMVCTLADSDDQTRSAWKKVLCSGGLPPPAAGLRVVQPGRSRGTLVGGNLATLCHLVGTPFAAKYANCILFIEETGEMPYRLDRMLVQMKLAGCFDRVAGLVLGSFKACGELEKIERQVRQIFDETVPIVAGLAAGHATPNLTLPLGITADLDAEKGELAFVETALL
jgi:muramoyltetrapeptide carboxypeptidase